MLDGEVVAWDIQKADSGWEERILFNYGDGLRFVRVPLRWPRMPKYMQLPAEKKAENLDDHIRWLSGQQMRMEV